MEVWQSVKSTVEKVVEQLDLINEHHGMVLVGANSIDQIVGLKDHTGTVTEYDLWSGDKRMWRNVKPTMVVDVVDCRIAPRLYYVENQRVYISYWA